MNESLPEWAHAVDGGTLLNIQVKTLARVPGVLGVKNGWLEVGVNAAPEKNAANRELQKRLAKLLSVPASAFTFIRGNTQRKKVILVANADPASVVRALNPPVT